MLDGIMHMGRLCAPYQLGDRVLNVSIGLTLADYREVEAYIVNMRRNPIDVIRQSADLPAAVLNLLIPECIRTASAPAFVRGTEFQDFTQSPHGMAYDVWRALRDNEEDFGMIPPGDKRNAAYKAPNGKRYSLTPEQGIQKAFDLATEHGQSSLVGLAEIARTSSQELVLGNSIGPTEMAGQTTTPDESSTTS